MITVAYFSGTWPFTRNIITWDEDFNNFSIVDVSSAFEVEITQSNSYSIKITADDNIMEHIQVTSTGVRLTVGVEPGILIQATTLKVEITMPALDEIQFSGATHGIATGFSSTHKLTITLSGASSLDTDISAEYVEINLSGASHLKGTITASEDAKLSISGASNVELTGEALCEDCSYAAVHCFDCGGIICSNCDAIGLCQNCEVIQILDDDFFDEEIG